MAAPAWELSVTDGASEQDVSETIRKAVGGHRLLAAELLGTVAGEP